MHGTYPEERTRLLAEEKAAFVLLMKPLVERAHSLVQEYKGSRVAPIIAIAGCSGVGKSKFTRKLRSVLEDAQIRVAIFKGDDFLQPTPVTKPSIHATAHRNLDSYRLHEVMKQLGEGKKHIQKPVWEHAAWIQRSKREEVECFDGIELILFEGTYALCGPDTYDFLKYSQCRVFIDAPEERILQWNWERELRGTRARTREKFDEDVAWDMEDYRRVILPSKKDADFIITKDESHAYHLFVPAK